MPRFLGCDPGLSGGLAVIDDGGNRPRLLAVIDIPTIGEAAKRRVDVLGVMRFLQRWEPDQAAIERAGAMPKQGVASTFNYGRAVGALEACLTGSQIPLTIIEPRAWKAALGLLGQDKEGSRQRALALYPEGHAALARKKDHNRSEAILIAHFGAMQARGELPRRPVGIAGKTRKPVAIDAAADL